MSYTLNNLGSKNFEHLVQALCKKIIGEGVSIYGAGPDGQREATFNGKASYPSDMECWDGYWIIQAKFKEPSTKKADYPWLKDCFEAEMINFQKKKEEDKPIPDNYLFFTNVVLTPVAEKGIKDKIEKIANNYKSLIPHIHIIGADDINRFLDGNRDIAVSYASYILSGDILSYLYDNVQTLEKERQNTFFRYIVQAFYDDYSSRMEQAGQVTDEKVSIDKVYVDLKFKDEETDNEGNFIDYAVNVGNELFRFSTIESRRRENNINLDEPYVSNKYVLKGSAGQGKSTVCQFLAQIYRATFIEKFYHISVPKIDEFLSRIQTDKIALPTCCRIPIRIELRLYSAWMIHRKKEEKLCDLVTYISSIIAEKAADADKFDNHTLRLYLGKYSWVFFFDGLDEVPESSNRRDIMSEIDRFIEIELRQANTDALFFATTRPEGYVGEFNKAKFTHIDLLPFDYESCFVYLNKLLLAIEDDSTKRKGYLKILNQGWDNDQIAFMMQTPLQATIITILVRAGGEPPRDKYSLFKEYFDIIIKREKQKGMGNILNTNQDLVEGVYYLLGYELQKRSSTTEGSDALISLQRLKELIKQKLSEDGIEENETNYNQLLDEIYLMIVNRINFASEIKEGYIGFLIRSMQEFLAAVYVVKTIDDTRLGTVLKDLAKSSYWKNTFVFLVECIAKIKIYYLDVLIDTVLSELNGNDLPLNQPNATASVCYGSQVAFTLLASNIFKNKPKYENKLCKYITKYCNLQYCVEMPRVLDMSDNVKKELAKYLLCKQSPTDSDFTLTALLLQDENVSAVLADFKKQYAVEIARNYFIHFKKATPPALYELVSIALERGEILNLNITQIIDFIGNVINIQSHKSKETLFKITIKCILENRYLQDEYVERISQFWNCNFKMICEICEYPVGFEPNITDYLTIGSLVPTVNETEIKKIISLSDMYSLDGLSLILKTIGNREIENYRFFYENIAKHQQEIELLREGNLIQENNLMRLLWRKALNDDTNYSMEALLGEETARELQQPTKIQNLDDFFERNKKDYIPYPMMASGMNNAFLDFIEKAQNLFTDEEIKLSSNLRNTIMFLYSCQYRHEYSREASDLKTDKLNELGKYWKRVLEFAKADTQYSLWKNHVWCFSFWKIRIADFLENQDMIFDIPKQYRYIRPSIEFDRQDLNTILDNIVKYISMTANQSALIFLYDFILAELDYTTLKTIDWSALLDFDKREIAFLCALSQVETEAEVVEKILPLLEHSDVNDFIFNFIWKMKLPDWFLPAYVYYLQLYRNENNAKYVRKLEKRIRDYITAKPINI